MTREELISECKRRSENGGDVETAIEFLRASGCSKIDSIAVLVGTYGIDLAKAKEVVHFSPTWNDARDSDEEFHELIVNVLAEKER